MNLEEILANSELRLEQQFSISALEKMDLNNVSKEQLHEVLVSSCRRIHLLENLVKELFKEKL